MLLAFEFFLVRKFLPGRDDLVLRFDVGRVRSDRFGVRLAGGRTSEAASDPADLQAPRKPFQIAFLLVGKVDRESFDFHGAQRGSCSHHRWRQRETGYDRAEIAATTKRRLRFPRAVRPASLLRNPSRT